MNENETPADIVAELRQEAEDCPDVERAGIYNRYADRIEAAHKREVQDALDTGGYVEACRARKSVGNAAKLRSALEHIAAIPMPPPNEMAQGIAVEMREVAIAALSAPPRNCDRFDDLKSAQRHYIEHGCSKGLGMIVDGEIRKFPWKSQFEKWLFAPAEEQKGETNGRK